MKRTFLNNVKPILVMVLLSTFTFSCTDLELEETDALLPENLDVQFDGVADVEASITDLYNNTYGQLGDQANFFALNEVSTDEMLVPTRGTDWGDNGIWRTLHAHTWSPSHAFVLNTWNNLNQNIFRATEIIDPLSSPTPAQEADARFLRAFSMFFVVDLWGVQPFRNPSDGVEIDPSVLTSNEGYSLIKEDLTFAIANLPARGPSAENNRASKAAARFLMAKLELNAERYTGSQGDMASVISNVDAIAAEGYAIEDDYFGIFKEDIDNETIWFLNTGVGNRIWNGLHYNQIAPDNTGGGWNGFSTLAEFYDSFEGPASNLAGQGQEERRGWVPDGSTVDDQNIGIGYGMLVGPQWGATGFDDDGVPTGFTALNDRAGSPLDFTKELPGLNGNGETTGIRVIKYHPNDNGSFRSHEIMFRYSDAHLMKAEAMMRSGGDATSMVNELRSLRDATPLGNVGESELLAERGRELYVEFWRRNDMLRFGQYTRAWEFKDPGSVGDATRELFPIPINALLSNPNLVQNAGY